MKKILLLFLIFACCFSHPSIAAELEGDTLTLSQEGTLSQLLSDMAPEKRIKYLTLRGPINWADLRVLITAEGRLENMESLDLRDVTLIYGGDYYASSSYFGDGTWFTTNELYYLSNERHEERRSDGLSSGSTQYHCYYDYNLAGAFIGTKLKRIVMPKTVNEIGRYAFFRSASLETVEYDQPPIFVGDRAFYECDNLKHIPDLSHVTNMDEYAFCGCKSLLDTLNLSSLDSIPMHAFTHTMKVDSVVFSDKLHYIGVQAFRDCGLKTFKGNGNISFMQAAFESCNRLQFVNLSDKVSSFDYGVFAYCPKLNHVEISPKLTRLPADLFYDTPWFNSLPFDHHVRYIGKVAMMTDGSQSITFRDGTVAIADAFNMACRNQPDVGYENPYPIYKSSQLPTSITLPQSLRIIGNQAFSGHQLTSLTLPDGIEEIGYDAFKNCLLEMLSLPSSLKKIGVRAFASNTKLMRLTYNVPNAEGDYSFGIFNKCTLLERVDFGPDVLTIPVNAFSSCKQLVTVNIPEGVQTIGYQAFNACTALSEIELPSTVTYIDRNAFYGCTNLLSVWSNIKQPVELEHPFDYKTYNRGTLYVPAGTKELYEQVWGWKEFGTIVEMSDGSLRGDANGDGEVNMDDATFVTNIILGTEEATEAADVNNDGTVNMPDAMFIVNKILNGKFPDEE